ncbi:MAG: protein phosphatase 2C domain-containing protein [Lentisphaeria bacterium]|nr:protein phosphatase 2C domain-containing protein [Lentisphaeria bacterium]
MSEQLEKTFPKIVGCSRRGHHHVQTETPCQDSWGGVNSYESKGYSCVSVADGHGADIHDLSEFGSELAVQALNDQFEVLIDSYGHDQSELERAFEANFPQMVVDRWQCLCLKDAEERLGETFFDHKDYDIYTRYGTTLQGCMYWKDRLWIASVGDGNLLTVGVDGSIVHHDEEDEPIFKPGATFSMASLNPANNFRLTIIEAELIAFTMLSTDGLYNSFLKPEYFLALGPGLLEAIRQDGVDAVDKLLPEWLDYFTENGSGDDITLAALVIE